MGRVRVAESLHTCMSLMQPDSPILSPLRVQFPRGIIFHLFRAFVCAPRRSWNRAKHSVGLAELRKVDCPLWRTPRVLQRTGSIKPRTCAAGRGLGTWNLRQTSNPHSACPILSPRGQSPEFVKSCSPKCVRGIHFVFPGKVLFFLRLQALGFKRARALFCWASV